MVKKSKPANDNFQNSRMLVEYACATMMKRVVALRNGLKMVDSVRANSIDRAMFADEQDVGRRVDRFARGRGFSHWPSIGARVWRRPAIVNYLAGGEPFSFGEAGGPGVLRFTASPAARTKSAPSASCSMRAASRVRRAAAGHATDVAELEKATADDYFQGGACVRRSAQPFLSRLSRRSIGRRHARLASRREHDVGGLVRISAPVFLYPMMGRTAAHRAVASGSARAGELRGVARQRRRL